MFEKEETRTEIVDLTDKTYENRICPKCNSRKRHIINSYMREIADLGSLYIRKVLKFESITFRCLDCGTHYLVEIEEALKGHQYSKDVIEVSMQLMFDSGLSAEKSSEHLKKFYNVEISSGTLYQWFNKFKSEYIRHNNPVKLENFEDYSGFITVDSNFSAINDKKGKQSKNKVENKKKHLSLFLTPLGNGDYTCRLGEARIPEKLKKLYGI